VGLKSEERFRVEPIVVLALPVRPIQPTDHEPFAVFGIGQERDVLDADLPS
jgi:hypothetical protein